MSRRSPAGRPVLHRDEANVQTSTLPVPLAFSCLIEAPPDTIYRLLAEVELWPAIFPHIASARVTRRLGDRRLVAVRTSWRGLPIGWHALQLRDPGRLRIAFHHVNRLSSGSSVTWALTPLDHGVQVTVTQQVALNVPIVGRWLAARLLARRIGPDLARAMLRQLKAVAEGGSLAGPR